MSTSRAKNTPLWKRIAWNTAPIVVFLTGGALIIKRCGVGILFTPWAWLGVVLATTALAVHPSIERRSGARGVFSMLVMLVVVSVAAFVFYRTSPKALFRSYVAEPIPASVRIVHREYQGGMDPVVFLHFRLDQADLGSILRTRSYGNTPESNGPSIGPSWWAPGSLRNPTVYYWEDPESSGVQAKAWLWVNEAKTEAYFTYWNF